MHTCVFRQTKKRKVAAGSSEDQLLKIQRRTQLVRDIMKTEGGLVWVYGSSVHTKAIIVDEMAEFWKVRVLSSR